MLSCLEHGFGNKPVPLHPHVHHRPRCHHSAQLIVRHSPAVLGRGGHLTDVVPQLTQLLRDENCGTNAAARRGRAGVGAATAQA